MSNNYISKLEVKLIRIFAFLLFVIVVFFISLSIVNEYNYFVSETQNDLLNQANAESNIRFSGGSGIIFFPLFHIFNFFIFIAIYKTKRFLLPFLLTIFYTIIFIYGLSARFKAGQLGGEEFSPKVELHKQLFYAANSYDYFVAAFILILLFWQITILLRILLKTLQRKNNLL